MTQYMTFVEEEMTTMIKNSASKENSLERSHQLETKLKVPTTSSHLSS